MSTHLTGPSRLNSYTVIEEPETGRPPTSKLIHRILLCSSHARFCLGAADIHRWFPIPRRYRWLSGSRITATKIRSIAQEAKNGMLIHHTTGFVKRNDGHGRKYEGMVCIVTCRCAPAYMVILPLVEHVAIRVV